MTQQWPRSHYATGLERQAMRAAGLTRRCRFCGLHQPIQGGNATGRALDTRDVRRILKGLAVAARLGHGKAVSGHSLRVGMTQDLVAANMDMPSVMQAGGWTPPLMVSRYVQKIAARRGAVARYYGSR